MGSINALVQADPSRTFPGTCMDCGQHSRVQLPYDTFAQYFLQEGPHPAAVMLQSDACGFCAELGGESEGEGNG